MNRRVFSQAFLGAMASYLFVDAIWSSQAFARTVGPLVEHWLRQLHDASSSVKNGTISPAQWQEHLHALYARVGVENLCLLINFEKLTRTFPLPTRGVHTKNVVLPPLQGVPKNLAFYKKIFGMKKERAIIPHGHTNMVSCHYILQGEVRLRHYDKVEENTTHMVIRPTVDTIARAGSYSSISDESNNIHWLVATTEKAFTFDVLVLDIQGKQWGVDNIDPLRGETEIGGAIRVPKIGVAEGVQKYGWDAHH